MTIRQKLKILVLLPFIFSISTSFACTCIGKENLTTETQLKFTDLAITGKVIGVANFTYYDTMGFYFNGIVFDEKRYPSLIHTYKVFTIIIDKKFKAAKNTADTTFIVTHKDSGACGYQFEIGKSYIIYAETWKEKTISVIQKRKKIKRKLTDKIISNTYFTTICSLTQESNAKELEKLKHLTEY